MWGNTLGWMISALLALAMGSFVYVADRAGEISRPTDFALGGASSSNLALPASAQSILPAPTERIDAGSLYRQAIKAYQSDPAKYQRFNDRGKSEEIGQLDALEYLVKASASSRATIFVDQPDLIVNMQPDKPALDALAVLGDATIRASLFMREQDAAASKNYAQAAFVLGARLFEERLTAAEMIAGLGLMSESAVVLKKLAQSSRDISTDAKLAEFDAARQELYKQQIEPLLRVLNAVDERIVGQHAGDVFHLAEKATERVWRVEAIFALGRMKYFVGTNGRIGDQRGALRVLKRLSNDSDPVIRAAATSARDLTLEQYRKQH